MNITLYENFSKRRNSTKQPTGGTTVTARMKRDTSTENPVFLLSNVNLAVNYVGFNGGYYFVDDIVLGNNDMYELHCSIDVLATWKTLIGSYRTYIERSESDYDVMQIDNLVSTTQRVDYQGKSETDLGFSDSGCYVFRVAGVEGPKIYATDTPAVLGQLYGNATYGVTSSTIASIVNSLGMSALDCTQYITSIKWFPLDLNDFVSPNMGHQISSLPLGFWNVDLTDGQGTYVYNVKEIVSQMIYPIPTAQHPDGITLSIPRPANISDYRLTDPYISNYSLYLPGVGTVQLNSVDAGNLTVHLNIVAYVDLITGVVTYKIYDVTEENIIATYEGMLGIDFPIVSAGLTPHNLLETFVGSAMSGITGGLGTLATAPFEMGKAMGHIQGSLSTGSGNRAAWMRLPNVVVSLEMMETKPPAANRVGRPLYEYKTINTLSGYVKCGAASIDIPGAGPNKDAVNSYLNGGFYYE